MSRLNATVAQECIAKTLAYANSAEKRGKFPHTIDLIVNLKGYDVTGKDKKFNGFIRLPVVARPRLTVCVIADAYHVEKVAEVNKTRSEDDQIPVQTVDDLTKLNKNKKLIKKLTGSYDAFLASEALIRQIPRIVGPQMTRSGKFPAPITQTDNISDKIDDTRSTIKFALKKVTCLGAAIGHQGMSEDDLRRNLILSTNFLVSLLKKGWQNIKSVYLHSTMGPAEVRTSLLYHRASLRVVIVVVLSLSRHCAGHVWVHRVACPVSLLSITHDNRCPSSPPARRAVLSFPKPPPFP